MKVFDKYNIVEYNSASYFDKILKNEENALHSNNLIFDFTKVPSSEFTLLIPQFEKISLTLANLDKTFVVVHPTLPTDKWEEFILIPTVDEAIEYIFMDELSRDF
ncbi:MAG: hypothetical protein ACPGSD_13750 [Flavobacteriales bacterium]